MATTFYELVEEAIQDDWGEVEKTWGEILDPVSWSISAGVFQPR